MIRTVISRGNVPIRLTDERWAHITEEHAELAGTREELLETISEADRVLLGPHGELLAVRRLDTDRVYVVVYRETALDDGFVITAFVTTRLGRLDRKEQIWPRET